VIVFIVCDTGERYLSKVHNEDWLKLNRMLDLEIRTLRDISDRKKSLGIEEIVSIKEEDKVKDVLELITKTGYTNPVLKVSNQSGQSRRRFLKLLTIQLISLIKDDGRKFSDA
jgi:cystathionine beta-synthase